MNDSNETTRICPVTGETMVRGTRPMTITYKEVSETIDMPGWYAEGQEDGIHSGSDLEIADQAFFRCMKKAYMKYENAVDFKSQKS